MPHSYIAVCFDLFGTLVDDDARAMSGAAEALALLAPHRVAIVTSAPRASARGMLAHAGLVAPSVLITADDVVRGKPSPEPYALAARRMEIDPSLILVVEDSASGVDAAHGAGMDAAFVLRGRSASVCPRADYYVRDLAAVAGIIRGGP